MKDGETLKPEAEKCTCNVAMTTDKKDCPMMNGKPAEQVVLGRTCRVWCREKDHCHCVNICDAYMPDAAPTPTPAKKGKK